jgi:hypothetical protein
MKIMRTRAFTVAILAMIGLAARSPAQPQQPPPPSGFVDLAYPADALAARATGVVVVRVTTDASKRVTDAEALSGPAILRPAAVANARQWTLGSGPGTDVIVYRFEIDQAACNDDSRSLFRRVYPNLALITTCSGVGRGYPPTVADELPLEIGGAARDYPSLAFNASIRGVVVLELSTDASGTVTGARALNDAPLLRDAAIAHAKTWRVRTTTPRRGIVVYEFLQDLRICTKEVPTVLTHVTGDYLRLSACGRTIDFSP